MKPGGRGGPHPVADGEEHSQGDEMDANTTTPKEEELLETSRDAETEPHYPKAEEVHQAAQPDIDVDRTEQDTAAPGTSGGDRGRCAGQEDLGSQGEGRPGGTALELEEEDEESMDVDGDLERLGEWGAAADELDNTKAEQEPKAAKPGAVDINAKRNEGGSHPPAGNVGGGADEDEEKRGTAGEEAVTACQKRGSRSRKEGASEEG